MTKQRIQVVKIHEMAGSPPDGSPNWQVFASNIPLYPTVDKEGLYEGDPSPFHVTLDILQVGVTSANGLLYDDGLVASILTQLPGKGAKFGHSSWGDMGSPEDVADWVGHLRIGNVVYAKAYVPPGEYRENVRRIMRRGGQLRTSIEGYGTPLPILDDQGQDTGTYRMADFELSAIDFVRFDQAALSRTQMGVPMYSGETTQGELPMQEPKKITLADVPAEVREQILREANLTAQVEQREVALTEAQTARQVAETALAELRTQFSEAQAQVTNLTEQVTLLTTTVEGYRVQEFQAQVDGEIAALTTWHITTPQGTAWRESLRKQMKRALLAEIGTDRSPDAVHAKALEIWETEFKATAEVGLLALGGGVAQVAPKASEAHGNQALSTEMDALLSGMSGRFTPKAKG